jgi:hypothetical protein
MVPHRIRRLTHAAAATLAVAAYALPAVLGLVADVGHSAYHLTLKIQEHRQLAEALGLVHEGGRRSTTFLHERAPASSGHLVHSHDGVTHTHDAATDALLLAAEEANEESDQPQAPTVKISGHVPAAVFAERLVPGPVMRGPSVVAFAGDAPKSPPTPPPPRA